MLEGCAPWPADVARRYRDAGYWADITLWQMLEQSIERNPQRVALIDGERRLAYRNGIKDLIDVAQRLLFHPSLEQIPLVFTHSLRA